MLHTFGLPAIEWPKNNCERTVFMACFFFLGANSKDGFVSLLPQFQRESPRRLYAIKGGPGCGKSTCIRRLSDALGGAEEYFLCSSDPDSLDGAALPGLALLDGTAPHVFEIAESKMPDMNCFTLKSAMTMVAGTARSMGINHKVSGTTE